jgi:hypothetical protein
MAASLNLFLKIRLKTTTIKPFPSHNPSSKAVHIMLQSFSAVLIIACPIAINAITLYQPRPLPVRVVYHESAPVCERTSVNNAPRYVCTNVTHIRSR